MEKRSQPSLVLAILSLAAFMASLDVFIVNVAFTAIGSDFHGASLSSLSWVLNGYAIVYAALLVPLGRLADRFGRKTGFLAGLALFTAASAACALAPSLWTLILFRVLQAAGAAALTPTSLGLLLPVFPPERRAGAVRIWASTGALAAAAGPAVGGLLVSASWRWVFLVNVPIGIIALIAAARVVPDARDNTVTKTPDIVGAGVLTAAIALLSFGLVEINDWSAARTTIVLVLSFLLVGAFWWRSLRHVSPVIEPALLRVRSFAWANVTTLTFNVAFAANLLVTILWVQEVWGYSAIRTGLAVVPGPVMVPIFAAVAGRLIRRGVGVGRITAFGTLLLGAGIAYSAITIGQHPSYVTTVLPSWIIGGIGVGFAMPTMLSSATADLPAARYATGSAIVNMGRQVGTVLGVSVLVAAIGTPIGYHATYEAFERARFIMVGFTIVAAIAALGLTTRRPTPAAQPADRGVELEPAA